MAISRILDRTSAAVLACALLLPGAPRLNGQSLGQNVRVVNGTVTDQHHEPLSGAVVYVENDASQAVVSYLTDRTGHFEFKHLSLDADYHLWASYREQRTRRRFLSHFDSKPQRTFRLEVHLR